MLRLPQGLGLKALGIREWHFYAGESDSVSGPWPLLPEPTRTENPA